MNAPLTMKGAAVEFEAELAAVIERFSKTLTDNQIIMGLERALDEALAFAGETEASKVDRQLRELIDKLLTYSRAHYGDPTDTTFGVGLVHEQARAATAKLVQS